MGSAWMQDFRACIIAQPPHPVGTTSTIVGIISRELLSPRRPACACRAKRNHVMHSQNTCSCCGKSRS